MSGLLRAEVLKLRRSRALLWTTLGLVALFGTVALSTTTGVKDADRSLRWIESLLDQPEQHCSGKTCLDETFRRDPAVRDRYVMQLESTRRWAASARAAASVGGVAGLALALFGSGLGALLALLLGVFVVGLELGGQTLGLVFSRQPRRWRFVVTKVVMAWCAHLAIVGIVVLCASALAAATSSGGDVAALALPSLMYQIAMPMLTGAVFASIGVALTFVFRSTIVPVVVTVAWIVFEVLIAKLPVIGSAIAKWTIGGHMWSLGKPFHERASESSGAYWLWESGTLQTGSALRAGILLIVMGALVCLAGVLSVRRDERS